MDIQRYLERKRRALEEVRTQVAKLEEQIGVLRLEEGRLQARIQVAEDMAAEEELERGRSETVSPVAADAERREDETLMRSAGSGRRLHRKKKPERRSKSNGVPLIEAIRSAAREIPPPISTGAVKHLLRQRYPDMAEAAHPSSISGTMRRMVEKGDLEVVEKGGPGKEATYRLPEGVQRQLEGFTVAG